MTIQLFLQMNKKSIYTDISLTQSSNKNLFKKKECINFTVTKQRVSTPQTLTSEESYKIGCEFYKEGLYEKAFKHFSNLAEQGYSLAQKSLADMYFKGEGTEKDLAKSLEWYEKAAEQGNDNAQFSLGLFFFCGNGVTQDYAEAKKVV